MSSQSDLEDIEFRYTPWTQWLLGMLAAAVFAGCMIGSWTAARDSPTSTAYLLLSVFSISILGIYGNTKNLLFAADITLRVSPTSRFVEIIERRLYGTQLRRYQFSQIARFKSYKPRLDISSVYLLSLILSNRKLVRLRIPLGNDKTEIVRVIKQLNRIIRSA